MNSGNKIYDAGYHAYYCNIPQSANPFLQNSRKWVQWNAGYEDAEKQFKLDLAVDRNEDSRIDTLEEIREMRESMKTYTPL